MVSSEERFCGLNELLHWPPFGLFSMYNLSTTINHVSKINLLEELFVSQGKWIIIGSTGGWKG